MEAVFTSARFSLTAGVSQGALYLVLGFVGIHFAAASRCASTKFSYSSFGVPFSAFSCSASNLFLNSNAYLSLISLLGQLSELTASAVEHKIDIICIQEHRYTHTEDIKYHETGNGWMLVTVSAWKNSINASVGGVGMLLGPRALKTLNSIERIQPRMMAATFNGNPKATIISCYSPTNVSEENEIVTFYEDLSSLVRSIPKHNLLVIGGDMNAQIGKNRHNKHSLHNASNRNGQHLIDFKIENRLTCLNTNFQKREGKLWTYTYANKSKAQIDYVLINGKWKNSAMNCEAYSSFEGVSSDHRIVTAKVRLSLRKNATRKATTKHYCS